MRNIINKLAILLSLFTVGFVSCTPEFTEPPVKKNVYEGKATHTIAQFKSAYNSDFRRIDDNVIIRGIVNATDVSGNIYKKLYLQDETGGIEVSIDATSLYTKYRVGQEIYIECKGLYVGKYGGVLQLGYPYMKNGAEAIGRMPQIVSESHIFLNGAADKIVTPVSINSISELTADMTDKLITINKVFFTDGGRLTFAEKSSQYPTSREFIDIKGKKGIVYTSSYAKFALDTLPKGQGPVTAILSSYNGQWQLIIRDKKDIGTFDPSVVTPPTPPVFDGDANKTIAEFKGLYNDDLKLITDDIILKGIVTSSDETGNIFKKIYIQDATGAIELNINAKNLYNTYKQGQEVFVVCKGLYMGKYGGVHQIGDTYNGKIGQMTESAAGDHIFTKQPAGPLVVPAATDITSLTLDMVDKLVTIKDLTFTNGGVNTYAGSKATAEELKDAAGNAIILYTSNYASFAGTTLPQGKVTITAIASMFNGKWQLIIRDLNDVVK